MKAAHLSPEKRALLEQRLRAAPPRAAESPSIPRRPERDVAPLSFIQRQMWVLDQMTPGNPAYNLLAGYRLRGHLDVRMLERSFNEIIKRHETLRTTFSAEGGEPQQQIHPELTISIRVTPADEARLQALASEEAVQPFDLSRLPLIRVTLFRLGDSEHVLLINVHHIVADGWSFGLLLNELDTLYAGSRPPELAVQYGDFAHWQRRRLADETAHATQIEFWRTQLAGKLPVLELPVDRVRPAVQSFAGSNLFFTIPPALAQQLADLGARHGCTAFMTMLAAFQVLLQRHAGVDDLIIGTPLAERTPSALEPLIGNFLNMVALRCDLAGDPTFVEVLRRSHDTTVNALSNGVVPFETVMRQVTFERDTSRNPIFQVMLQMLAAPAPRIGNLDVTTFHFDLRSAQLDLSLHLYEEAGGYLGRFEYCSALFERETVERMTARFEQLLRAVVANPDRRISEIPLLPSAERELIVHAWNDTAVDVRAGRLIHELFEAQVDRAPARTAVCAGKTRLSYAELDARANRLAWTLRSRGIGRGDRVGLGLERGSDMLAALLGILKSGAAYVPLDPAFPVARLRFMADDAQLACLVADADLLAAGPTGRAPVADGAGGHDPAYVIYTSGSTGTPKGVAIPHRAVVNFLTSMAREPGLDADDVLVAVTTLSFDIAVLELLLPLTVGATVVMATRDEAMEGRALRSLLEEHRATVMQATPVTWRLLLEAGWRPLPVMPFRALVGGEPLPQDLAQQLIGCGVELWNMYGPTETTVWSTCARITDASRITIGSPIANTTVRVLDTRGELSPIGVPGELCIGGTGVALGYWNRPELTAERFIPDPFGAAPARLYRTGDRVRWRGDGTLEHLGRFDDQVKLRGFRIEVGEIESAIAACPGVREVAVAAREDQPGAKRLVAYVVAATDLTEAIRARIRSALPEYMVPTRFVTLDALPRT
ncbi:MAG TPA: amino acid adenylation domain-containing protein, partial [Gemmatimonadales bacterium]|nr:amino acid adenylation domain-containing protein [Gemmatimonadales bacterium]